MQRETTKKRSWLKTLIKVLMWTVLVLIVCLGIAYWTAPSWVPGQVQKFLPDSVQIKDLKLKRPGLTSTQIDGLTINLGQEEPYKVQLKNVTLGYSLWRQKLTSINAESAHLTWPQKNQETSSSPSLELIPLPVLPVADIKLEKLTIEGLTLQNIVANNIVLEEYTEGLTLNTRVQFLDKNFIVKADAQRNNHHLSKVKADITQNDNRLAVTAVPITSEHWTIKSEGQLKLQELYPQPGIEPASFVMNGSVKNQEEAIQLTLEESSKIESSIDIKALQLDQMVKESFTQYPIKTNFDQLDSNYQLTIQPNNTVSVSYRAQDSKLVLEQGDLAIKLVNPSIKADFGLQQLQLNLNEALSAGSQKATLIAQASIKDLKGSLDSPEHTTATTSLTLDIKATVKLLSSALNLENSSGLINLGPIDYTGNNSTATANSSQWRFQGNSKLSLVQSEDSNHQWKITNVEPINANLKLSDEQFSAQNINANLQFLLNKQTPQGRLQGNYELSNIGLVQQPLKLESIKGEIDYSLGKAPKGNLSFNNARYKSKQIGVSNIAGKLDWTKKTSAFVASGNLTHDQSKISFSYSFNLESSKHNLKIAQSSLPVSTITSWLNILKDYPQLSFNSGQLEINSLDGDPIGLLFDGKLKLDNFNLNYDEFYVRNWTIEDSLTPTSKLGGTLKSHIDSIELATDIAITDISFLMPHTINSLVVTDLKGKLLNGSIDIPKLAVNESGIPPFTAYLKAIDINALLTALNSEKLKLTGRFDFTLPLTISDKGQQITNGKFKALGEGVVKLKSDKGEEANIAFQALENFHYKEFSGSLNYNLDGDYVVELHVLGSNPDLYNGFPIKLDLTLRGQLPELLYSMIVSGDMTKPILDDLQQKQILNIQP